jgi:hypothetical protein
MTATRAEAMTALKESGAWRNPKTGLWTWHRHDDPIMWHSEEDALTITRACLYLDVPVTDTVTGFAWLRLIERVVAIEQGIGGSA